MFLDLQNYGLDCDGALPSFVHQVSDLLVHHFLVLIVLPEMKFGVQVSDLPASELSGFTIKRDMKYFPTASSYHAP